MRIWEINILAEHIKLTDLCDNDIRLGVGRVVAGRRPLDP